MICAAIVSYNSEKVFRCYGSIKNQADFVVIVDNGTKNNNIIKKLKHLSLSYSKCKIILNDTNLGIASALNTAAFYAKENNYDWILTLDQDSEIPEGSLQKIMSDFNALTDDKKNKCAIVAYKYIERNIPPAKNSTKERCFKEVKTILTSGNIIQLEALDKIGYMEEKLFIDQVDNDLDFRLRKYGYTIMESCNHTITHELGEVQKKCGFIITNHSPLRRYYLSRNSIYILKNYFFFDPKHVTRLFIGSIFGGIFKITFFEKSKFKKYKYIIIGIFDGIFNRYGKRYNP